MLSKNPVGRNNLSGHDFLDHQRYVKNKSSKHLTYI